MPRSPADPIGTANDGRPGGRPCGATAREPRSRSRETTFTRDLVDRPDVEAQVAGLARELATDAISAGRRVVRVALKVHVVPYLTRVRVHTLPGPTLDADTLVEGALGVLERFDLGRPVRLLGVRVDYAQPKPGDEAGTDAQSRPRPGDLPAPGSSSPSRRRPSPAQPGGTA